MKISFGVFLTVLGVSVSATVNSTSYLQATWLPNSYESYSEESMYNIMSKLKNAGVHRVYVDVWNQGKVYFTSETMINTVGVTGIADDHLQWALSAASKLGGMEVWAWFEYGLMPAYGSLNNDFANYASVNQWILGQYPEGGFYWLDPSLDDVLAFLAGIMSDCLNGYADKGLQGVQLDDHFASPVTLGKTQADMDAAMNNISNAIRETAASLGLSNPLPLSLSPSTLSYSISTYNVNWNAWGIENLYTEVIPQIYRTTFDSFKTEFDYTLTHISRTTMHLWNAAGVRLDGSGDATEWDELEQMLDYSVANGRGAAVWYARGIIETYPDNMQQVWA